jgi:hypothetical protein
MKQKLIFVLMLMLTAMMLMPIAMAGPRTFGDTTAYPAGTASVIEDTIKAIYATCPTDGYADNITVYLNTTTIGKKAKCALYAYAGPDDAGHLINTTEEKNLTSLNTKQWVVFNFSSPKPAVRAGLKYYIAVWGFNTAGSYFVYYTASTTNWLYASAVYGSTSNPYPNPMTGEAPQARTMGIYVSYTEATIPARDYYVATTGNDTSGNGTLAKPYLTIQKALNMSANGDNIYIRTGTYTVAGQRTINRQNMTIKNYNNEAVTINGQNIAITSYSAVFRIYQSTNIRISGLRFYDVHNCGITFLNPNSRIRVDNCTFENISHCVIYVPQAGGSNNITFEHCTMNNTLNNHSGSGTDLEIVSLSNITDLWVYNNTMTRGMKINIDIKNGCKRAWVYNNIINTTEPRLLNQSGTLYYGGSGIYLDCRGAEENISIYNNKIWGNHSAISVDSESTPGGGLAYSYFYNNIFLCTALPCINIRYSGTGVGTHHHVYIYQNTLVHPKQSSAEVLRVQSTKNRCSNLFIYNNIIMHLNTTYTSNISMLRVNSMNSTDGTITLLNNIYYRPVYCAPVTWLDGTKSYGTGALVKNPLLYNAQGYDFRLNHTSPAINNASTLLATTDYANNVRPLGVGYDIGAYEHITSGSPPVITVPSPANNEDRAPISTTLLSAIINDPDGNIFRWNITTSPNIGTSASASATNGTKNCTVTGIDYGTTYTWTISAFDTGSETWTNTTYTFTSRPGYGNPTTNNIVINYLPAVISITLLIALIAMFFTGTLDIRTFIWWLVMFIIAISVVLTII